jgi:hypothetical protein
MMRLGQFDMNSPVYDPSRSLMIQQGLLVQVFPSRST